MHLNETNPNHILMAMSGGVDSSVAAALLKEQGYQVTGLMLHLWCESEEDNKCCTPESVQQARSVASQLEIPFYVADAGEPFRQSVVKRFFDDYKDGRTPNPCYTCNQQFRWKFLLKWAFSVGAAKIATGHYARIRQMEGGQYQLLRGLDEWKDQSYMLSGLDQDLLAHTMLPLGTYRKTEIREKARQLNLIVADKEDSQDLCFLGKQDYRDFLKQHLPEVIQPGDMVTRRGEVVGRHEGLAFYTIGQRKGLGGTHTHPMYVLEKDVVHNHLIVGFENELGKAELTAEHVNWMDGHPPSKPGIFQVKIRYRSEFKEGYIEPIGTDSVRIVFNEPLRDITPGQIAVIYDGDVVVGSGIICN